MAIEDLLDYRSGSMPLSRMPHGHRRLGDTKHVFILDQLQGIETSFTSAYEENPLRPLFLDRKMIG
jgi:hypothetical protein